MTADARVLQFPTAVGAGDYGRFSRELSDDELAGCFFFTDDDRARIAVRRSEINRLGFALQLGTVRYLGRFLENPVEVPASVLGWTARELAVPLSLSLVEYGQGRTRFDHQAEICAAYGYRPFDTAVVEREFVGWLQARAWVSAESQRALFARAAEHLIGLRVLLPGHSTLWRVVASARERADARGYAMLTEVVTDGQRDRLLELLRTPAGRRLSTLERLRRPVVDPSIKGLIGALERERELRVLAEGLGGLDALPVARLRTLMVDAERQRAADVAKMGAQRRLATLIAFAITASERGQDDALELFDRLHGELILRAQSRARRERLADGTALDAASRRLVDACRVVLDDTTGEPVRDAVFAAVGRDELAEAVNAIARLGRSPDDRARELVLSRYPGVRKYLPALLDTIAFMANDAGQPVLDALAALNATWGRSLSVDQAPLAFASAPWRSLVEPEAGQLDRAAYAMCAVEGLRDGLRRRDIYVAASRRYADARSSLLGDPAWEASREDTRRSLALPADPGEFVQQLATDLDLAYDRTLEGLDAEHPVLELAAGRLHLDALDALPEPPSLIALRDRVDALLPAADLPDLVLEIAAKTGFIDAFTNDEQPDARLEGLTTSLCAVLVAQACNVGYTPLVDENNPALRSAAALRRAALPAPGNDRRGERPDRRTARQSRARRTLGRRRGRLDRRAAVRRPAQNDPRRLQPSLVRPP